MSNTWSTSIEKLMHWRTETGWTKYETFNFCTLKIHYDQMVILSNAKVLETVNLYRKIKGFFKDDVIILILQDGLNGIRKVKFQVPTNSHQIVQILNSYFPVISHSNKPNNKVIVDIRYRRLNTVLQVALNNKSDNKDGTCFQGSPESFEQFVKLCLMDPMFPTFVNQTEKVLKSLNK